MLWIQRDWVISFQEPLRRAYQKFIESMSSTQNSNKGLSKKLRTFLTVLNNSKLKSTITIRIISFMMVPMLNWCKWWESRILHKIKFITIILKRVYKQIKKCQRNYSSVNNCRRAWWEVCNFYIRKKLT